MRFPDYFPDQCPPEQAHLASGVAYRLVDNDPPNESDFTCHRLLYPKTDFRDECEACGISYFVDIDDADKLRRQIPAHRNKSIAKGQLKNEFGLIKHTPSKLRHSHHSLWIAVGTEPWKVFYVTVKKIGITP